MRSCRTVRAQEWTLVSGLRTLGCLLSLALRVLTKAHQGQKLSCHMGRVPTQSTEGGGRQQEVAPHMGGSDGIGQQPKHTNQPRKTNQLSDTI